jgi:tetratricopeptide (TPR) repeat protein
MSTIEPSTQGMIVPKQIGRRVMEIMEEKGKAFTQQALATRIGMGRQTLSMKLRGERDMYLFELRRIAEALHLPLARIMQEDTHDDEKKLQGMFASLVEDSAVSKITPDFNEIFEIAHRLSLVAVGMTERCKTLNDLGRAFYYLRRYDEANKVWQEALEYAKKIAEKYNNHEYRSLTLSNLLVILTISSNRIDSYELLDEIEQVFSENPHRLGVLFYVRSKIAEEQENIHEAKTHAMKSLDYFRQTGNFMSIGKAEVTVAHYEFILGNYATANSYLNSSIVYLKPHMYEWLVAIKDYAKTLLKLHEYDQMEIIVSDALSQVDQKSSQYRDLVGKLKILLSMCRNEISHAESVLFDNGLHVNVRTLAYKYLRRLCIQTGDKTNLMKYAIIEDELETTKNDLLHEELFT